MSDSRMSNYIDRGDGKNFLSKENIIKATQIKFADLIEMTKSEEELNFLVNLNKDFSEYLFEKSDFKLFDFYLKLLKAAYPKKTTSVLDSIKTFLGDTEEEERKPLLKFAPLLSMIKSLIFNHHSKRFINSYVLEKLNAEEKELACLHYGPEVTKTGYSQYQRTSITPDQIPRNEVNALDTVTIIADTKNSGTVETVNVNNNSSSAKVSSNLEETMNELSKKIQTQLKIMAEVAKNSATTQKEEAQQELQEIKQEAQPIKPPLLIPKKSIFMGSPPMPTNLMEDLKRKQEQRKSMIKK